MHRELCASVSHVVQQLLYSRASVFLVAQPPSRAFPQRLRRLRDSRDMDERQFIMHTPDHVYAHGKALANINAHTHTQTYTHTNALGTCVGGL